MAILLHGILLAEAVTISIKIKSESKYVLLSDFFDFSRIFFKMKPFSHFFTLISIGRRKRSVWRTIYKWN